jgi:peptidoglycan/LPS O-acetylase OafA/YrhL
MSATNPLAAIGALAVALLTVSLLQRRFGMPPAARRFAALDGLRGYAAFLVFCDHSSAWYFFERTGLWTRPPSLLFHHFGQSSVAFFFMITGLLFWSKLLDAPVRPIDWRRLYISRVLRLTPLFVVLVASIWTIGLAANGLHLRVSASRAILQTVQWLTFTTAGMPEINFMPAALLGGVAWSLPYEWWFYLALPAAALLTPARPAPRWVAFGIAGALGGAWWVSAHAGWSIAAAFLGGIAAAYLVRAPGVCAAARSPAASVACLGLLAAVTRFPDAFTVAPLLLLSIAFATIACGNTIFGALHTSAARGLGEIGYGVYLLHSMVLFVAFELVLGHDRAAAMSVAAHWTVVYVCAPLVVVLSFAAFRLIEAPAIAAVDRVNGFFAPTPRSTATGIL